MCIWSRLTEVFSPYVPRFATSMLTRTFPDLEISYSPNEGATLTYFENINNCWNILFYCFIDNDFHLDLISMKR